MNYGNLIIEDLKIGDIYYEIVNGTEIECEINTLPVYNDESKQWTWISKNTLSGNEIHYVVNEISSTVTFATEDTI